jgi:hypothetical protein
MKNYIASVLLLASAISLGSSARAQERTTVEVSVPFEFNVGTRVLPAGDYTITAAPDNPSVVVLRGDHVGLFVIPVEFDGYAAQYARLHFDRVADRHFLSSVSTPAGTYKIESEHLLRVASRDTGTAGASSGASK